MTAIRSKYRAVKTEVDGIVFHSKKEAKRYGELKLLLKCGDIHQLELQPHFELAVNNIKVASYIGDFRYITDREIVIEDVKGFKTPEYRLKKKLMWACHGIKIAEV